jgi:hypothetical protein
MTPEEAVAAVIAALDTAGIPYMVAGSFASSHHGRPRSTHDADIVIDPDPASLDRLTAQLDRAGFYVDAGHARDALRRRRQFNAIESSSAFKIDLIIRKDRPFSREEFERRRSADLGGGWRVWLATAEDTLLAKLEWARRGGDSEKQLADAAGIVAVVRELDHPYIERWARELGVLDLWQRITAEP